jgi:hypothetical protein
LKGGIVPKGSPGTRTEMLMAISLQDRLSYEYKRLRDLKRQCKRTMDTLYYAKSSAALIVSALMREYYDDNCGHYPNEHGIYPYPK